MTTTGKQDEVQDTARKEDISSVRLYQFIGAVQDKLKGGPLRRALQQRRGERVWPVISGAYIIGDPTAPVAVCALTSDNLVRPLARTPGVAIAGRVQTVNLGIEKILLNVTSNRAIRFLLLCGKESPIFQPAQALRALLADGVDAERRIIGAKGHFPVLQNTSLACIEAFRQQVELVDCVNETDVSLLTERIRSLAARNPGPAAETAYKPDLVEERGGKDGAASFTSIHPGGHRQPLAQDPKGFFVITLAPEVKQIVIHHYLPDHTPGHEMRGRSAEGMLLGLLQAGLVSQLSHAGYLGGELTKAETALRLGLAYEQDQPLRLSSD